MTQALHLRKDPSRGLPGSRPARVKGTMSLGRGVALGVTGGPIMEAVGRTSPGTLNKTETLENQSGAEAWHDLIYAF